MRSGSVVLSVLVLALAAGCAPVRVSSRTISTDWATVAAIPKGTLLEVGLERDQKVTGELELVTDDGLTIRRGTRVESPARRWIVHVSTLDPYDPPKWRQAIGSVLTGCLIGGLVAIFVHATSENGDPAEDAAVGLSLGCGGGALVAAVRPARPAFRHRLVYWRP